MLRFDSVTLDEGYEPPRPPLTPRERVQVLHGAIGLYPEYLEDWGLAVSRPLRFISSPSQGFLTGEQVSTLLTLYETGAAFALETDLLKPLGEEPDTYTARFDPTIVPLFTPAEPGGHLYLFDVALIIL
jgi:hypothetical protein